MDSFSFGQKRTIYITLILLVALNLLALIQGFSRASEPETVMEEVLLVQELESPTITLISPVTTQLETTESSIVVSFRSTGDSVFVNGNQQNLSRNNEYETQVLLTEGSQLITIEATNNDDKKVFLDILVNKITNPQSFSVN